MTKKNRHEGASLDSMFEELGELQEVQEAVRRKTLVGEQESRRQDAEAQRDTKAGIGIPLDEAFAWLHDRIDGIECPKPKARKQKPV
ncbi:hypothetical protein [Dongia sp. agr-C8]